VWESLKSGSVIWYPYLWKRQSLQGETEGRKSRPTVVAVRIPRDGGDLVLLFAITTSRPDDGRWAIEVPETERQRSGLDAAIRQWLILDETNLDRIGTSFYLSPAPPIGTFSRTFFGPIVRQVIDRLDQIARVRRR
jgi:hypothetical protein